MSAITHIRFYPSDWLAGTRGMTAAETGVYITLIAMLYENGGAIRADDNAKLARLCGTSASSFKIMLDRLVDDGKIIKHNGTITNARVELEIRNVMAKSEVARGKAAARWSKTQAISTDDVCSGNAEAMLANSQYPVVNKKENIGSLCSPTVGSLPLASGQESLPLEKPLPKSRKAYSVDFESLWSEWPQNPNESKKTANDRWLKLTADERHDCFDGALAQGLWLEAEKTKRKGQDPPRIHLSTFISERRWETLLKTEFNRYGRTPWQAQHHH